MKADPRLFRILLHRKEQDRWIRAVAAIPQRPSRRGWRRCSAWKEFNAFATQFNENLAPYLDCVGKGMDLADRAKGIAGHKAILEGLPVKTKAAETRGAALLAKYPECRGP